MLTEPPKDTRADVRPGKRADLPARLEHRLSDDKETLVLEGDWRHAAISGIYGKMLEIQRGLSGKPLEIDLSGVKHFDTAGAWLVRKTMAAARDSGTEATLVGAAAKVAALVDAIPDLVDRGAPEKPEKPVLFERLFAPIGKS
ncbi:MAG: STAS domain-containing protein, partial [Hoeflea sp.]|nr:STAS domain-containing protein [Hoeflea sp.]